jgi:hypothetical protein
MFRGYATSFFHYGKTQSILLIAVVYYKNAENKIQHFILFLFQNIFLIMICSMQKLLPS